MAYRMTANGELAYRSHSECGNIVITGISGTAADHIYMCINGDFMLYPDSLRISRTHDENQVIRIYLGDSLINQGHTGTDPLLCCKPNNWFIF